MRDFPYPKDNRCPANGTPALADVPSPIAAPNRNADRRGIRKTVRCQTSPPVLRPLRPRAGTVRRRSELQLHAGGKAHAVIAVIGPVVELRIAEVATLGEERHLARKEPVEPRRKVDRDGDFEIVEADNATTEVQPESESGSEGFSLTDV